MIEELLDRLVRFSRSRPRAILAGALLAAVVSSYALFVPIDLSFSGVMNRDLPEVSRYFAASEKYGLGGILPLLLEGPEERLDSAAQAIRAVLAQLVEVRSVVADPPRDWLLAHSPWIVDADVFTAWVNLARSPGDGEAERQVARSLDALQARLAPTPPAGTRLIQIEMAHDSFELALDAKDFPAIRSAVERTAAPLEVTARFAGMPAIIAQEQEATIARMRVLGPLSLLLVLAILFSVERRARMLLAIAIPLLLSVGCTLALIGFAAGELTLMESIFGVLVFGLGIDFAIHLLLRVRDERLAGRDFDASMHTAVVGTGRGVVAGAATTAGAFFILSLAPDPVFYRLGLAGGLGLSLCLAFQLLMLPVAWSWADARSQTPRGSKRAPSERWLGRVAGFCASRPRIVLAGWAAVLLLAAFGMHSLRYETNLERVFSREIDAVDTARRIQTLFGVNPSPWVATAPDLEGARQLAADFRAEPTFARVESLGMLLRKDADARRDVLDRLVPGLAARSSSEPLALLIRAHALGPPRIDTLPAAFRQRYFGPDGEFVLYAYADAPNLDSAIAAEERRAAQSIDPGATSINAIYEALIGTDRPWMLPIVVAVAVFIVVVIRLDFGNWSRATLALIPVVAAGIATLGVLGAIGFSFNTVTLVAIPLLLGLAVDDGIHVVHRMVEEPDSSLAHVVGSVAPSIGLTTATTCGSVTLLLFTRHPGVESVAVLLLIGLPIALLATVTLLPAAARLEAPGEP